MHRKIVRIISNENKNKIEPFYRYCEYHHLQGIRKFIYHNDINIEDQLFDSIHASRLLASQGFCVILISAYDEIENVEIFIPEKISMGQLEYFYQEKLQEELKKCNSIVLYNIYSDNQLDIINKHTTEETMLDELKKELQNRLEITKKHNKTKKLTKTETNTEQ